QRIEAYCTLKDVKLAQMFEEPGGSGAKPLNERPAAKRLLAEAKRSKATVVVAKLDRLFRSVADAALKITEFDSSGVEPVSIAERFDMTSPYGRAMAQMASVFAELERAMITERTRAALRVKKACGERISRTRRSAGSSWTTNWSRTQRSNGPWRRSAGYARTA